MPSTEEARAARPDGEPVLSVRGVTQRFGDRLVLDAVDLDVRPGRVVGLLGPNGAGKTTLMRIVFGVIEPDGGRVGWRGRPATDADRRSWGYMPQERGLYRDMRVEDQLVWLGRLHGLEKPESRRRTRQLLEQLGLADRGRDTIKELSGGMVQRVQLAAAMVHTPEVLVLDEPFAGLDPNAVEFLSQVVVDHAAAGHHVVLSSHQLDLVEDVCEEIFMLHRGRVVLAGGVAELKARSPERYLRVDARVDPEWLEGAEATVTERTPAGTRIRLGVGADAVAVLDRVRDRAQVHDFGVEAPTLSELFLAAAGEDVPRDFEVAGR
jgi:ABC-2 type transport system ATP-binding protein